MINGNDDDDDATDMGIRLQFAVIDYKNSSGIQLNGRQS